VYAPRLAAFELLCPARVSVSREALKEHRSSPQALGRPERLSVPKSQAVRSQNLIHARNLEAEAFLASLEFMAGWIGRWILALRTRFRRSGELLLELIILRHQLAVLERSGTRRPCLRPADRLFWVLLSRWWVDWRRDLMIVQPATVLRWRRQNFRSIWKSSSRGRWRGGRPRIDREIRDLTVRMSRENFLWGAPQTTEIVPE
jgi:hypothetical protein